jgi:hypothetical protein
MRSKYSHLEFVGIGKHLGAKAAPDFRDIAWYNFLTVRALINVLYNVIVESTFQNSMPILSSFEVPEVGGKM